MYSIYFEGMYMPKAKIVAKGAGVGVKDYGTVAEARTALSFEVEVPADMQAYDDVCTYDFMGTLSGRYSIEPA